MFLSTHASFALVLFKLPLPLWSILLLSFLSHFLLDILPHGDENLFKKNLTKKQTIKKMIIVAWIDILFLIIIIYLFFYQKINYPILLGVFLACLPDGLQLLNLISSDQIKFLSKFHKIHQRLHNPLKINLTLNSGIIIQLILIILTLWLAT